MSEDLRDARRGPRAEAAGGGAGSVVVFLHGYGADGADLLALAEPLAAGLPRTAFRAPDAPESCRGNPFGYQWFPIPGMDTSTPAEAGAGFARAREVLDAYLDRVLAEEGVAPARLALVGFSQGTMMALAVAPERAEALAGVVGFSGRLVDETAPARARSRPPVLLLHGDQDPLVPFDSLGTAAARLSAAGFSVRTHVMPGTGHGIAPDGLAAAAAFLGEVLG